ncbi:heme-binding domain-containing protein [Aureisphaera sp. CAU 1614]|uniref:Heme-binding domain-containing protein n=1 Tax=Halomarinibacterium sedimenti TaxID=2857106 RepID=A0A9X1JYJ8_9FLAO|nr:heme-binding domain-containing protein [Halomarinibacterium sedimenti]MBW2937592.1 heme-binding domain-containing protein [Halomarinibacterium sedimenti]
MKKILKYFLILALLALVVIQFIRPEKNLGGYESVAFFESETKPSQEVRGILKNNCYDCHSNHTNYPWYAEIAPFSFYLDDHVRHGKGELNFSEWENFSAKKKDHKLEEVFEEVEKGEMPLDSYTWIHGNLSKEDQKLLLQWAQLARMQYSNQIEVSGK